MGSNQPQARAKSLLVSLNLKFFASNSNYETNQWASEMIGKQLVDLNKTRHQHLMPRIMPDHFTTFKKANGYKVETVVFKAGKAWEKKKENFAFGGV